MLTNEHKVVLVDQVSEKPVTGLLYDEKHPGVFHPVLNGHTTHEGAAIPVERRHFVGSHEFNEHLQHISVH